MTEPSYAELTAENQALKEAQTLQGEDRAAPQRRSFFSRGVGGIGKLPWETMVMLGATGIIILAIGYFGGSSEAWALGKVGHVAAVLAYAIGGFFVTFVALWVLNRVPWIRERATPAADDSKKSIEEWRAQREADPGAPWTETDARMSHSASLRYGASILVFGIIMATAMMLAK